MAFCSKCGSGVTDGVAYCPQCGAPIGVAAPGAGVGTPAAISTAGSGLQENVAGLLCYLLGWLTGIIFLMIDKRPLVRFHAAQSIVVFGFLFVLRIILSFGIVGSGFLGMWAFWSLISILLSLVTLAAWIILMVLAYQGKRYEVPIAAGIAKKLAGQV
jgi:uncharacterized membrane protein